MSNFKYAKTYKPIINWENVTEFQFKTDWKDLLADKAATNEWNRDRIIVALLNIIEKDKLESLMLLLANRRVQLVDFGLIRKAMQMDATNHFYHTGAFVLADQMYVEYLDNMRLSTSDGGNVLFHFYQNQRKNLSAAERALFIAYVEKIENEKLKKQILDFVELNDPEPQMMIEDPAADAMAALEELANRKLVQEEMSMSKESKDEATITGKDLQPSVVNESGVVLPRLYVHTGASPNHSPVPKIKAISPVITHTPIVATPASLFTRFANKWKALPTRYKIAAFGFAVLGIVATVLGIVFPPSLTVTVPVLKLSSSTVLTYGGAALTAATLAGHAIHINKQPAKTEALPISKEVTADNLSPAIATEAEEKQHESISPSPVSSLTTRHEHAAVAPLTPASNSASREDDVDHCESTRLEVTRSRRSASDSSSLTILSILQAPHNSPRSASSSTAPTALPTPSSRAGEYVAPQLARSNSVRTAKEEDRTKVNKNGERIATISPRMQM